MKKKIAYITIATLTLSLSGFSVANAAEDYISAPINPLPSTYKLNTKDGFDYNLDVPPPINPQPQITHDNDAVFTTENTPSSSTSKSSTSSSTKKSSKKSHKSGKQEKITHTTYKKPTRYKKKSYTSTPTHHKSHSSSTSTTSSKR